ncbi:hypothetical protein KAR91_60010 [Candidatus Pacearchaeota archaeon]|nr:hypothetical protein [Candidatus Pacearchaeota archaeon]
MQRPNELKSRELLTNHWDRITPKDREAILQSVFQSQQRPHVAAFGRSL